MKSISNILQNRQISKVITIIFLILAIVTVILTPKAHATHTSTNIVVDTLNAPFSGVDSITFNWIATGSTPGVLAVGTNGSDPIVGFIASMAINTADGFTIVGGNFTAGVTYHGAMYTGGFGEVLMSNIASATILAGDGGDTGTGNLGKISPPPIGKIATFTGAGGVAAVLRVVVQIMFIVGFVGAFICILIGTIFWIVSGGDPKAVQKARGQITACIVGLVILLSIFAIISVIEAVFGINILSGGIGIPSL